jgi:hypothetical protein
VLLCIAHDPGDRLRDTAASPSITERSAHGIITGLTTAGYTVKQKDGRRNRYQIQAHMPLREPASQSRKLPEPAGRQHAAACADPAGLWHWPARHRAARLVTMTLVASAARAGRCGRSARSPAAFRAECGRCGRPARRPCSVRETVA